MKDKLIVAPEGRISSLSYNSKDYPVYTLKDDNHHCLQLQEGCQSCVFKKRTQKTIIHIVL